MPSPANPVTANPAASHPPSAWTMGLIVAFVVVNVLVPVVFGEVFPFTCAPMFREAPRSYCNYRMFAPDGTELTPAEGMFERHYNGNPIGLGVGVTPPRSIDQFGAVHEEAAIREHGGQLLSQHADWRFVEIEQEVIAALPDGSVGRKRIDRWRIERGAETP